MQVRLLNDHGGQRTFAVVLGVDDEVMESLGSVVEDHGLSAAQITAIGAFRSAELYFFEWESKEYLSIPVEEQTEVASLLGDVALGPDGKPALHIHAVLSRRDGSAVAGHLAKGFVRPTLEVLLTEQPAHLRRRKDPESGLPLIAMDRS